MFIYKQKNTGRIVTCEMLLNWDGYEAVTDEKDTANETAVSETKKEPPKKRAVKK